MQITYKICNVLLRGITLVSKFALIFFLAKFLSPGELGIYGLFSASIGYGLFFVGFEFYTYTTRELIGTPKSEWTSILKNQLCLYLITYFVFLLIVMLVFYYGFLPWEYFWWFIVLLMLEHFAQELNRLLVAMMEQLFASIVLFVRSGLWCVLVIIYMSIFKEHRNISVVFYAWAIGGFLACALGVSRLGFINKEDFKKPINWKWIYAGLVVAIPLLIATLSVRGLFTFDRYFVKNIAGLDILGAYVFFVGIANSLISFLDSGVIVFMYPRLVNDMKKRDFVSYVSGMKSLLFQTIIVLVFLSVTSFFCIEYVVSLVGKPIYVENVGMFYWLIASMFVFGLGMVPQLGLYACNKDRPIFVSHVFGLILFVALVLVLQSHFCYMSVPYSLFFSMTFILLWKTICFIRNHMVSHGAVK